MITSLQDPDPGVRRAVAETLRDIGDPSAVEPLLQVKEKEKNIKRVYKHDVWLSNGLPKLN